MTNLSVLPYGLNNNRYYDSMSFNGLGHFRNPIKNPVAGPYGNVKLSQELINEITKSSYKKGVSNEELLRKLLGIPLLAAVTAVASKSAVVGNDKVTTLIDGDQYFDKAMEFVKNAKNSVQIEMFEFQNLSVDGDHWVQNGAEKTRGGKEQQQLLWELVKKKQENPDFKAQVILDAHKWYMDSKNDNKRHYANQDMIKFLKDNGIDVVPYPRASQSGAALQHIKLVIADGEKAILGGMNWGTHSTVNHDGSVAIEKLPDKENSVVDNLLALHFNPDWKFSWERIGSTDLMSGPLNEADQALYKGVNKEIKQENVEYYNLLKEYFDTPEAKNRYKSGNLDMIEPKPIVNPEIQVLGTKTKDLERVGEKGMETTREYLMDKIKTAKKMRAELFVLTDKELVETVIKRHKEGTLDARFIIDPSIIKEFPYCENAYDELKEAGVPVRVYRANKAISQRMHAKWAIFDDKDVMIGSTNWSAQGLNQNMGKGKRADYALTTDKIDTRIRHSFEKVKEREEKLQLEPLEWTGDNISYSKLKERKAVLSRAYNALLKKGEAEFSLDGNEYKYTKGAQSVVVNGKTYNFDQNDEKDALAELRTIIGYYDIVQRKHLSKQKFMRGNNELAVAFSSPTLAKSVFLEQFDRDWKYCESKYDDVKTKKIPINAYNNANK